MPRCMIHLSQTGQHVGSQPFKPNGIRIENGAKKLPKVHPTLRRMIFDAISHDFTIFHCTSCYCRYSVRHLGELTAIIMSNLVDGIAPYPFEEISGITNVVFYEIWTFAEHFAIRNVGLGNLHICMTLLL